MTTVSHAGANALRHTITRAARRAARRVGRRGASLLFVGMLSLVVALSVADPPPEARASPGYVFLDDILPLRAWAAIWAVSGITCLVQAFRHDDRLAFSAAVAVIVTWGTLYVVGSLTGVNPRGWVLGGVFIALGGWLALISSWAENPPPPGADKKG